MVNIYSSLGILGNCGRVFYLCFQHMSTSIDFMCFEKYIKIVRDSSGSLTHSLTIVFVMLQTYKRGCQLHIYDLMSF